MKRPKIIVKARPQWQRYVNLWSWEFFFFGEFLVVGIYYQNTVKDCENQVLPKNNKDYTQKRNYVLII